MPPDLKRRIPDFSVPKYENLVLSLQKGTCIFTGAGISKLGGYKLWDELKNEMVDYFWMNKGKLPFKKRRDLDLSLCENLKKHGDIYLRMLDKRSPDFDKKHIRSIMEFLYNSGAQENANRICNIYGSRGNEFLRDIYEKHAKST